MEGQPVVERRGFDRKPVARALQVRGVRGDEALAGRVVKRHLLDLERVAREVRVVALVVGARKVVAARELALVVHDLPREVHAHVDTRHGTKQVDRSHAHDLRGEGRLRLAPQRKRGRIAACGIPDGAVGLREADRTARRLQRRVRAEQPVPVLALRRIVRARLGVVGHNHHFVVFQGFVRALLRKLDGEVTLVGAIVVDGRVAAIPLLGRGVTHEFEFTVRGGLRLGAEEQDVEPLHIHDGLLLGSERIRPRACRAHARDADAQVQGSRLRGRGLGVRRNPAGFVGKVLRAARKQEGAAHERRQDATEHTAHRTGPRITVHRNHSIFLLHYCYCRLSESPRGGSDAADVFDADPVEHLHLRKHQVRVELEAPLVVAPQ